jgi:hypothetical protein
MTWPGGRYSVRQRAPQACPFTSMGHENHHRRPMKLARVLVSGIISSEWSSFCTLVAL